MGEVGRQAIVSADAGASAHFSAAFAAWRRMPPVRHLGAIGILVAFAVVWWPEVTFQQALVDEEYYLGGIEQVIAGQPPYAHRGYYYPAAFAILGAALLERVGEPWFLAIMRGVNLFALAGLVWFSLSWVAGSWGRRVALAAACFCLAPGIHLGVVCGNVSFVVIAMIFAGFCWWRRLPWLAGAVLGTAAALKPVSPVALLALLAHRPLGGGRRHLVAGGVGLVLIAVWFLAFPYLDEMLELGRGPTRNLRTVSLHRLIYLLGFEVGATPVFAVVAALTALAVRLRRLAPTHLLCVAVSAVTLATPMLWNHLLVIALPIQVLALSLALRRYRGSGSRMRLYGLVWVILGIAAIQFCDGVGGVVDKPQWMQIIAVAPPSFAPSALTVFILKYTDPF